MQPWLFFCFSEVTTATQPCSPGVSSGLLAASGKHRGEETIPLVSQCGNVMIPCRKVSFPANGESLSPHLEPLKGRAAQSVFSSRHCSGRWDGVWPQSTHCLTVHNRSPGVAWISMLQRQVILQLQLPLSLGAWNFPKLMEP